MYEDKSGVIWATEAEEKLLKKILNRHAAEMVKEIAKDLLISAENRLALPGVGVVTRRIPEVEDTLLCMDGRLKRIEKAISQNKEKPQ